MKIFVSGASGYIGSGLLRALGRAGHRGVGLARSKEKAEALGIEGVEWVIGNVRDPATYRDAAAACDGIVHAAAEYGPEVAAVDRTAIDAFVGALRAGGSRRVFVYTSGVWVIGVTGDKAADETAPVDRPAQAVAWRPAHERDVLDAAGGTLVTAVVRPGNVYGGHGGSFGAFFRQATDEGAPTVVGDGKNRWPAVHRDDLADLYIRVLELAWSDAFQKLPPRERLFHAVDGSSRRVGEIARAASLAAGRDGTVRFWPVEEARSRIGPVAEAVTMDQLATTTRSGPVLGWHPRVRDFVVNAKELFGEWARGQ